MAEKKKDGNYTGGRPKDLSKLSDNPAQVRVRARRALKRAQKTGDDTHLREELDLMVERGMIKPVHEWDLEELAHGRPRNSRGTFTGRPPTWLTPEVTREAKKRLYGHAFGKLGAQADLAIRTVKKLIENDEVDDKGKPVVDARTKLDASKFILEHILGKPQQLIEIDATDQARQMLASAIVLDNGQEDSHLVIEGSVVEKDEELMADDD